MSLIEKLYTSEDYELGYDKGYADGYKVGRASGIPEGKWIIKDLIPYCEVCGKPAFIRTKHCPECGARLLDEYRDIDE